MQNIKVEQHSFAGTLWIIGWLYTIGFLKLAFLQGVLAVVVWPYYLGSYYSTL